MIDSHAYLRKLNDQELGFRRGESRKAGRYVYISKKSLSYFPPLSSSILNDHVYLNLIAPNSGKAVLSKYVYHNDKIVQNKTRDEFRIYLNTEIDPRGNFFRSDDILVFHRIGTEDDIYYKLYHFPAERKDSNYRILEGLLLRFKIERNGAHAIAPISKMPFINLVGMVGAEKKVVPPEIIKDAFESPIQAPAEEEREPVTRLIRDTSFRSLVLFFYDYKCAITGTVIRHNDLINLQAAHIIPRHMGGGYNPSNGLALSQDLHWAFDKGFFTVDAGYRVQVHDVVIKIPALRAIHDKQVRLPQDSRARPNVQSLKWHQENVFGIFLKSTR